MRRAQAGSRSRSSAPRRNSSRTTRRGESTRRQKGHGSNAETMWSGLRRRSREEEERPIPSQRACRESRGRAGHRRVAGLLSSAVPHADPRGNRRRGHRPRRTHPKKSRLSQSRRSRGARALPKPTCPIRGALRKSRGALRKIASAMRWPVIRTTTARVYRWRSCSLHEDSRTKSKNSSRSSGPSRPVGFGVLRRSFVWAVGKKRAPSSMDSGNPLGPNRKLA